jgi:hypothetical protein
MLLAAPAAAQDESTAPTEQSASERASEIGARVFDVVVLRSTGAVQTAVGLVLFAPAGLLSLAGGGAGEAWDTLVMTPYQETFEGPLGRF